MLNQSCLEFIDALASSKPVPGGGGASALVGSVGMALGSMVGNLTVGKKKYADVEEDMRALLVESEVLIRRFNELVKEDAEVFEPLSRAYGLPSGTEEEKAEKERVLQEVLVKATLVPMEIAENCLAAMKLLEQYAKKGSRIVISDAGVGVIFCKSALQGAKLNVLINLKLMKDETLKSKYSEQIKAVELEGLRLADEVYEYVEGLLCC
ncbi:cyclodeaminase/cyclohydrolase family protein [Anoxybacterium hadale]|uniref:Cyclodeaminase/cyclohydrolase family protein n=1 Tax=Anoxybacterium hadale TaxID=3408580 RepID=A0ACD1A8F6_9FIRM|nr:cyclodeaminase/cyclohydrolase family protein [Clostridiales bacterium]